jgi:signal transduction histidine kinase/CheY-like chemotaxis protein
MPSPQKPPRTIRLRLAGLVLACVLPVWVCAGYLVHYAYTGKRIILQGQMSEMARLFAQAVDRELTIVLAAAEGLTTSPALLTDDFKAFRSQVKTLLAGYPESDVIVADASGQQVFNSFLPEGAPLPKRAVRESVRRVFATGRPGISNVFHGAVTGRALVSLDMPVRRDGVVRYDLGMTVPVSRFAGLLAHERLPAGWTVTVLDAAAAVAARSRDNEQWVGKSAAAILAGLEQSSAPQAAFEAVSFDNQPVLAAYAQAAASDWGVLVAVPRGILLAEVRQWLWWTGGGTLALSLGGILLALSLARRIAGSIDALIAPAVALGQGQPLPAGRFDLAETAAVAAALDSAAALLASRAAERRQAEAARQEAENRLAEREHIFRIVADNSSNWEFWDGPDMVCRWVSPACARISGYPPDVFLGPDRITIRDLLHPEDCPIWDDHLNAPGAQDAVHGELHLRLIHRDGHLVHIGHVCSRITGLGGEPLGRRGSNRDITEQYRYEQELRRAKEMADAGNRAKSEFLANMSHEIRTPVSGVVGMLELLKTTELSAEQQEYVEMAVRAAGRLGRLLGDILDLSKVESGTLVLQQTPFELEEVRQAVLDVFGPMARKKNLALSVALAPGLPARVQGDPVRLRQILLNLVGNAVKYTDTGFVHVSIAAAAADFRPVPGTSFELAFVVSDTGRGIPAHKLNDIFSPFVQTETALESRQGGVGLGLAIVKRLVELMGGRIFVCSAQGEGATLRVTLPLLALAAQPALTAKPELPAEPSLGPVGLVALVVEDDAMNLLAVERMLQKVGYAVLTARNGRQALELLADNPVDIVLMDVQMPVMDGLEATRRIRADQSGRFDPAVPVIALTAYAMTGDRERFLASGMDDYLAKPVKVSEMLDCMQRAVGMHGPDGRKKP